MILRNSLLEVRHHNATRTIDITAQKTQDARLL